MDTIVPPVLVSLALLAATASPGAAQERGNVPTDPVIAHIAVTADAIDVDMGRLALERAQSRAVKAFARTMVDDHSAVNRRAAALAKRLGLTPQDNPTSQGLEKGAAAARMELKERSGAAFDVAYIEHEVAYHQAVLDALDRTLIPNASNGDLKSLLEDARTVVAAHLKRAEAIRDDLRGAGR